MANREIRRCNAERAGYKKHIAHKSEEMQETSTVLAQIDCMNSKAILCGLLIIMVFRTAYFKVWTAFGLEVVLPLDKASAYIPATTAVGTTRQGGEHGNETREAPSWK